jgi:hypothetical protein
MAAAGTVSLKSVSVMMTIAHGYGADDFFGIAQYHILNAARE